MYALAQLLYFATSWITWVILLFGLVIGSFLNVCIFRIPEGTFWKEQRSVCRSCGAGIPWYLNIPVISWVFLRGRARCCGSSISWQYPLVEAGMGVLAVVLYWRFPFLYQMAGGWEIDGAEVVRFAHAFVLTAVLLICSVIDMRHMIVPDILSLPMIALTPVMVYLHPELSWQSALIGVVAGGASLYVVAWIYWLIRREVGMGMGDVKLLAAIGGWLGWQAIVPTVLYGSVSGALFGIVAMVAVRDMTMRTAIPFGPFLSLGAFVHLVFGARLQEWLFRF